LAKDGNNLQVRGQILSSESNGKVDTHTHTHTHTQRERERERENPGSCKQKTLWLHSKPVFSRECMSLGKLSPWAECETGDVRYHSVEEQRVSQTLSGYYVSCWFSSSLSPGHLINGPAGGIPGRV